MATVPPQGAGMKDAASRQGVAKKGTVKTNLSRLDGPRLLPSMTCKALHGASLRPCPSSPASNRSQIHRSNAS
jgi:hypothetical protein